MLAELDRRSVNEDQTWKKRTQVTTRRTKVRRRRERAELARSSVRKKKKGRLRAITNKRTSARDANDGQMKHKVRAASPSFSSLYPPTCTCACADRPLKLRPLSLCSLVRSPPATTCSNIVFYSIDASVRVSNRQAFPSFLDGSSIREATSPRSCKLGFVF